MTNQPPREFEYSDLRKEMNAAYLEIIKRREYKGARIDDILEWLAQYKEGSIKEMNEKIARLEAALQKCKEQRDLQTQFHIGPDYTEQVRLQIDIQNKELESILEGRDG